jgi:hypothetical protein
MDGEICSTSLMDDSIYLWLAWHQISEPLTVGVIFSQFDFNFVKVLVFFVIQNGRHNSKPLFYHNRTSQAKDIDKVV